MAPSRSRCRKRVHRGDAPDLLCVAGAGLPVSAMSAGRGLLRRDRQRLAVVLRVAKPRRGMTAREDWRLPETNGRPVFWHGRAGRRALTTPPVDGVVVSFACLFSLYCDVYRGVKSGGIGARDAICKAMSALHARRRRPSIHFDDRPVCVSCCHRSRTGRTGWQGTNAPMRGFFRLAADEAGSRVAANGKIELEMSRWQDEASAECLQAGLFARPAFKKDVLPFGVR